MKYSSLILGELSDIQQQHKQRLMSVLKKYLPPRAVEYCSELVMHYKLHLHIEVERQDRLGDYSPHLGKGNRISINHNLNPFDFLITFIHELAHHVAYKRFGDKHQPHGMEWKEAYKDCMRPFLMRNIFPSDIAAPLTKHMQYPRYTHTTDVNLMKSLMQYDLEKKILLEQLPRGATFKLRKNSKIILRKGEQVKDYFLCSDFTKGTTYKVFSVAKIFPEPTSKT